MNCRWKRQSWKQNSLNPLKISQNSREKLKILRRISKTQAKNSRFRQIHLVYLPKIGRIKKPVVVPKLKDICKKCPESTIQLSESGISPYIQNSFLWLIDYISFNIDTTYTYYISNNWKLSQDFAELLQYELRYLREELWAHEQFSFFSPQPLCAKIQILSNEYS